MKQELAGNREGVPTSGNRRATEESPGFSRGEGVKSLPLQRGQEEQVRLAVVQARFERLSSCQYRSTPGTNLARHSYIAALRSGVPICRLDFVSDVAWNQVCYAGIISMFHGSKGGSF